MSLLRNLHKLVLEKKVAYLNLHFRPGGLIVALEDPKGREPFIQFPPEFLKDINQNIEAVLVDEIAYLLEE